MYRVLWIICLGLFLSGCTEQNTSIENVPSTSLESQQPDQTSAPTELAFVPTEEVTTMSVEQEWLSELSRGVFGEWQFYDINLDGTLELIIRGDALYEDSYVYYVYRLEGKKKSELGAVTAVYYKETYDVEGNDGLRLYYDPGENRYFYLSDAWQHALKQVHVVQSYVNGERIEPYLTLASYQYDVDETGRLHITEGKLEDKVVLQDCYCDKSEVLEKMGLEEYLSDKVLVESNVLEDGWYRISDVENVENLHQAYEQAFSE